MLLVLVVVVMVLALGGSGGGGGGSQSYIAGWNDVAQGTHSGTDPPSAGGVFASNYCNQAISNGDASGWNLVSSRKAASTQ